MTKPRKPNILYVDDEPYNLTGFTATFRHYYTIYTATSGINAIDILKKHDIDLIITDQRMPDMTGVQFLEAVIPEYPHPTRMILTGFSDVEAIIKAINNGSVLRYITKPWNKDELKECIDAGVKIHLLEENNRDLVENLEETIAEQKKAIELFEKYVSKDIVNQVLNSASRNVSFEKEYRIISLLYFDIRQFTKFSEARDPKDIVTYLNKYLTTMIKCVTKNHGTVYQFMGDGSIAIFGAPVSAIYNQRNAAYCALDMIDALQEFNQTVGKEINYEATIGISIGTGEAIVGHIMTKNFLSYAVIGDVFDETLQIGDYTKNKPNSILVSESTYNIIKDDVLAEESDQINVSGKTKKLYQLHGKKA